MSAPVSWGFVGDGSKPTQLMNQKATLLLSTHRHLWLEAVWDWARATAELAPPAVPTYQKFRICVRLRNLYANAELWEAPGRP
jgi:hypothetical protein